jgi:hypothetical protein
MDKEKGTNISMIRGDTETIKISCKDTKGGLYWVYTNQFKHIYWKMLYLLFQKQKYFISLG